MLWNYINIIPNFVLFVFILTEQYAELKIQSRSVVYLNGIAPSPPEKVLDFQGLFRIYRA